MILHCMSMRPTYLQRHYKCCIPVFDGLLNEPHNKQVMKLLYRTAEWHRFAKLRMHTDTTLEHLRSLMKEFGRLIREFRDRTCSQFQTVELPHEAAAHNWNQQRINTNASRVVTPSQTWTSSTGGHGANVSRPATGTQANAPPVLVGATQSKSNPGHASVTTTRKVKTLNISTLKFHFLGDYVHTIQMFGCTDLYSTQLV